MLCNRGANEKGTFVYEPKCMLAEEDPVNVCKGLNNRNYRDGKCLYGNGGYYYSDGVEPDYSGYLGGYFYQWCKNAKDMYSECFDMIIEGAHCYAKVLCINAIKNGSPTNSTEIHWIKDDGSVSVGFVPHEETIFWWGNTIEEFADYFNGPATIYHSTVTKGVYIPKIQMQRILDESPTESIELTFLDYL